MHGIQGVIQDFLGGGREGERRNTAGGLWAQTMKVYACIIRQLSLLFFDNLQHMKSVDVTTAMPQCVCVLYIMCSIYRPFYT